MICINIMKNTRLHARNSGSDMMLRTPASKWGGPEFWSHRYRLDYYFLCCLKMLRCHKNSMDTLWISIVQLTVHTGPFSFMSYPYDISVLRLCPLRTKTHEIHTQRNITSTCIGLESKENHKNLRHNDPLLIPNSYHRAGMLLDLSLPPGLLILWFVCHLCHHCRL